MKDRAAIAGIGQTGFAKRLAPTELELAASAVQMALDDAGIDPAEVDALSCYTMEQTPEFELARTMGFGDLHFFSQVPYGGGAGCAAVGQVAMAIASGQASVGVVWRSRKRGDARSRVWAQVDQRMDDHWKWSRPSGLLRPVDEVAMLARRYMHEYGVGRRELADIAVAFRAWARNNPNACMRERPLDVDAYLNARMISDPLCLFDNCLESDGAVAVVITSTARARDLKQPPVLIHAFSQGLCRGHQSMTDYHRDQPLHTNSQATARHLWRLADFGPEAVDVAQIYDAFAPLVWFSLEAYGFCGPGEAPHWIAEHGIGPGGSAPLNTAGGSLSEAYIHGLNLVTEGVRQLRGQAASQIKGARTCLVTGCDSTPNSTLLLRRD